jgi:hypothetical protein
MKTAISPTHILLYCRYRDTNIKMDPREIREDGLDWIDFAQDRDQWRAPFNTAMNLQVP